MEGLLGQPIDPINFHYPRSWEIPGGDDPKWVEWAKPIYQFLQQPRAWPELIEWRRKQRKLTETVLAQLLAWLRNNNLAYYLDQRWQANTPVDQLDRSRLS